MEKNVFFISFVGFLHLISVLGDNLIHQNVLDKRHFQVIKPVFYHNRQARGTTHIRNGTHLQDVTLYFKAFNRDFFIDLSVNKYLFSKNFIEKKIHRNNGFSIHKPRIEQSSHCFYHGSLRGFQHSIVALSTCDGIRGLISDGRVSYHIDPSPEHGPGHHKLYIEPDDPVQRRDEKLVHSSLHANATLNYLHTRDFLHRVRRELRGPYDGNSNARFIEMYIVNDQRMYERYMRQDRQVIQRSKDIVNIVSKLYNPLNIYIALVGIEIWEQDKFQIQPQANDTLEQFLNYRKYSINPKHENDNAQLITGMTFRDGVVGKAIKASICTHQYSAGVSMDSRNQLIQVATTVAHELGHNLGMAHDNYSFCQCPDDKCIMAPTQGGIAPPTKWSTCSKISLAENFEIGMDYCLRNKPEKLYDGPVCGNGFVEIGEECDCGLPEDCKTRCCDARTCRLTAGAVCATGKCCDTQACVLKPRATLCRGSYEECDLPEFCNGESEYCPADVYRKNGIECGNGQSYCLNGKCKTHTGQCRLLWGPTGRVSDPICFQHLNVNGSSTGNCGYNLNTRRYTRCDKDDVMCGLLHCVHLNLDEELVLEAQLKRLKAQREMKMVESELSVLKEDPRLQELAPSLSSESKTEEYLKLLPRYEQDRKQHEKVIETSQSNSFSDCRQKEDAAVSTPKQSSTSPPIATPYVQEETPQLHTLRPFDNTPKTQLNPEVQPFTPRQTEVTQQSQMIMIDTFTKHLVKKDLIMSRLSKFDDDPIMYVSWKKGFINIMEELGATETERIELLCEKLGPESSRQARTIRACNADSPSIAIKKIWERLERRFGAAEQIENYILKKIKEFPEISTDHFHLLYDLADLASEIASLKAQPQFEVLFSYFDSKKGVNELVEKLPWNLKDKWTSEATKHKQSMGVAYPPFSVFVKFLENMAEMKNDPAFQYEKKGGKKQQTFSTQQPKQFSRNAVNRTLPLTRVAARKTEAITTLEVTDMCPLHKNSSHSLNDCMSFRQKPIGDRKKMILTNGICFKCCSGKKHRAKNCKADVKCSVCQTSLHPTALHEEPSEAQDSGRYAVKNREGNPYEGESRPIVSSACTKVHGASKSCAKIVPVRISTISNPRKSMLVYAIIDDQSNRSLATSSIFDYFQDDGGDVSYTLVSCSGTVSATGRFGTGYTVESVDGTCQLEFPELIECNDLPSNREEIPSQEVALQYSHLNCIASEVPPLFEAANIELLIGRDLISAHIVHEQIVGEKDEPFAQRLALGWVIVGQICLGGAHRPEVRTFKTFALKNGRPSSFEPCNSELLVNNNLFQKTEHDEKIGFSIEDREFLKLMNTSFERDDSGHWVAPLPFKQNRLRLPDNKTQALQRARAFDKNLRHNSRKYEHVKEFMIKLFNRGHAEKAPMLEDGIERWYLPMFGVYHPKKPESIRVVFDSSARFEGVSLNGSLMKGPDLSNSLQGVLMRFRLDQYAVIADVEQMFHNFRVRDDHRDYLRFLWHPNHDLDAPLEEFRMTVHVFGNSPSPSVATFGLRQSVSTADPEVQHFVSRNFYVDDGLMSFSDIPQAVDLIKRTQEALYEGGRLRLHKIASNSVEVLQHFEAEDLSKDLHGLDIMQDNLPEHRSLGIAWNIEDDTFIFRVSKDPKPFTRRGVLSVINSLFDPIGFTAPVTVVGKMLLREAMTTKCDWDDILPVSFQTDWESWVDSLHALDRIHIPRMYCPLSVGKALHLEVHIFSDASKEAVAAVAYLKAFHQKHSEVGFLLGKAKVAPSHGHTIPRLELCASVLAVEMAETIREELQIPKDNFTFYTDSQVVLGYISNDAKRFHVYVSNRVSRIRSFCGPGRWRYIMSEQNPADVASRGCSTRELPQSTWLSGPDFLRDDTQLGDQPQTYDLVNPDMDEEVRKQVTCKKTLIASQGSESSQPGDLSTWCERFKKFSTWMSLVRAIVCLKRFVARTRCKKSNPVPLKEDAERFIITQAQNDRYPSEIHAIKSGKHPPRNSHLISLNPVLDKNGILRVGGRTKHMKPTHLTTQPIIIPKDHHIATLLVRHYHAEIHHQGRHMTEGAVRGAGFWIVGFRRLVNSLIRSCIMCKKLRGNLGWTKMADLPLDRIEPGPPFSFVGVDAFGPWPVVVKKTTRGVRTTSKYWAILFTCLVSRAIHIELVGDMSSEAFINALRRFMAIRGPVRQFRSDRGTNFIGAMKELGISASFDESGVVQDHLTKVGSTWIFNPPYAHHFGGAWERLIGSCRRILDALLLENRPKDLTFDVLSTFMSEVSAIMNTRPLLPISSDPEAPSVLSPSMILTQKECDLTSSMNITGFGPKDAMKSQWKLVQKLADDFWRRWQIEYIHCLQTRRKWQLPGATFKVGDVVLVKDDNSHRNTWPVGIIKEVFPSKDDVIRKVMVTVVRDDVRNSYVRPITELIHLLDCE